jgi:hypothetical protein
VHKIAQGAIDFCFGQSLVLGRVYVVSSFPHCCSIIDSLCRAHDDGVCSVHPYKLYLTGHCILLDLNFVLEWPLMVLQELFHCATDKIGSKIQRNVTNSDFVKFQANVCLWLNLPIYIYTNGVQALWLSIVQLGQCLILSFIFSHAHFIKVNW